MLKSTIKHKNVEFTELFYDLVFVYAISKTTDMITVSMSFISHNNANVHFVTLFMYAGIFMFQWAVIANNMYSKPHLSFDAKYYVVQLWIILVGGVASYNLAHNDAAVLHITTAAIVAITVHSTGFFYMRNLKERRRLKKKTIKR